VGAVHSSLERVHSSVEKVHSSLETVASSVEEVHSSLETVAGSLDVPRMFVDVLPRDLRGGGGLRGRLGAGPGWGRGGSRRRGGAALWGRGVARRFRCGMVRPKCEGGRLFLYSAALFFVGPTMRGPRPRKGSPGT
jgi:hypothetical protein